MTPWPACLRVRRARGAGPSMTGRGAVDRRKRAPVTEAIIGILAGVGAVTVAVVAFAAWLVGRAFWRAFWPSFRRAWHEGRVA